MGKWKTVLDWGKKAVDHSATRATARSIGGAVIHPQRTLSGLGKATKTAVVGTGMGYLAWESIANDKPVVRAAADILVGEETVDRGLEAAEAAAEKAEAVADKAGQALEGVENAVSSMNDTWGGIGTFLKNILGGNGKDMFGSFFGNIGKGNVSGLSLLGLIASAFLVFGRFGWMGKIAGAALGMMLIGGNSNVKNMQAATTSGLEQDERQRGGGMRR